MKLPRLADALEASGPSRAGSKPLPMFTAAKALLVSLAPLPENMLLFRTSLLSVCEEMPTPARAVDWSWFCQKMLLAMYACLELVVELLFGQDPVGVEGERVVDDVGRRASWRRSRCPGSRCR